METVMLSMKYHCLGSDDLLLRYSAGNVRVLVYPNEDFGFEHFSEPWQRQFLSLTSF